MSTETLSSDDGLSESVDARLDDRVAPRPHPRRSERRAVGRVPLRVVPDVGRPFDLTAFPDDEGYDSLVPARSLPVQWVCEHHLPPLTGVAHVGYLPGDRTRPS